YYDKRHYKAEAFNIGDLVFIERAYEHTGSPTKTQRRFRGPLVVVETLPGDTYRVSELCIEGTHHYVTTAHVSQMKVWRPCDPIDDGIEGSDCDSVDVQVVDETDAGVSADGPAA